MEDQSGSQRATVDIHGSRAISHRHFNARSSHEWSIDARSRETTQSESEIAFYSKSQSVLDPLSSSSALRLPLKTLKDFVLLLQYSGIEGPAVSISNQSYIGKGSQFVVYKQTIIRPRERGTSNQLVAAKQPKYVFNTQQRLDLGDSGTKRQLHDLHLEVVALTHPMLRAHPNIIHLIAWGREGQDWHHPLVLFLELAEYDLQGLMSEKGSHMPWEHKYQICCNIAAGLDVIHDNSLAHGDLKPANVLICISDEGKLRAKIADFGFCVDEEERTDLAQMVIGTRGWQAPEIENGKCLVRQLALADNYSYGLVVWSVFLLDGECPPPSLLFQSRLEAATQSFQQIMDDVPTFMREPLSSVPQRLLQTEVSERALRVSAIIASHFMSQGESGSSMDTCSEPESCTRSGPMPFEWELPPLSETLIYDLRARCEDCSTSLPGHLLFNMALQYSQDDKDPALLLQSMCAASDQGYIPAQAVLSRGFAYVGEPIPREIQQHLPGYLANAVSSGSLLARESLKAIDIEAFADAKDRFQDEGGFNQFYTEIRSETLQNLANEIPSNQVMLVTYGHDWIHWFAIYASCQDLKTYLGRGSKFDINSRTSTGETALYLACLRGNWDIAEELLGQGASPSVKCTQANVTCLHWLFAFDECLQDVVTSHLIKGGADIHAISSMDMPIYHYPFTLPRGSPLFWSVVMQCHHAIAALLDNGADPLLRCGNDPYVYDERIRVLDTVREDRKPCSVADHRTLGLSSLDVAANIGDPFIFQHLHASAAWVDVNDTDEEGLAAIHRLAGPRIDRTLMSNAYDRKVFQGSLETQRSSIEQVVSSIIKLGGDINMPVMPCRQNEATVEESRIVGFTPLMLAMMEGNLELLEILLQSGANPRLTTETNKTVLMCLDHPFHLSSSAAEHLYLNAVKLLVTHGAKIHHRSAKGETAALVAASFQFTSVIEYLLSQGVDPDQVSVSEISRNMWTFLALGEPSPDEDIATANLLERYVFPLADHQKRYRILEEADEDGSSLLHYYARSGMIHCVRALLDVGCELNKASRNRRFRGQVNGPRTRTQWRMTPLDMAIKGKEEVKNPDHTGQFSPNYRGELSQRMDAMVCLLREAGGIEIKDSTILEDEISEDELDRWRAKRRGKTHGQQILPNDSETVTTGGEKIHESAD